MTVEAELPDGTILEFPDGTPRDVIQRTVRRRIIAQQNPEEYGPNAYSPNTGTSALERGLIGAGRGAAEIDQAIGQFAYNIGERLGIVNPRTADAYNRMVSDESALYERNLGDDTAANVGRFGSQTAITLPAGVIGAGARTLPAVARAGAIVGGLGGALTPVTDVQREQGLSDLITGQQSGPSDYFTQKAQQTAIGAGLGAALGAGGKKVIDAAVGLRNVPARAVNAVLAPSEQVPTNQITATLTPGSVASRRRGGQVAEQTGVNLTPGQRSGSKALTAAENIARGSIWTRDQMFAGDQQRARQFLNAIRKTSREVSPTAISSEDFATRLQGTVKNMVTTLAKSRSDFGRQAYGAVERAAGGAPIVRTSATQDEIAKIVDEFSGVQGSDAAAVAAQAERFFNGLGGDGTITPGKALRQLQAWEQGARTGAGVFENVQDRTTAKTLARRLATALQSDLDDTASTAGGSVGDALRAANKGWRDYSQKIDALEASALGRIVGEDFADDVAGVAFNRVAPEKVWQRLDGLNPSELRTVRDYLSRENPELWTYYQRLTLERAKDVAQTNAPSLGSRTLGINPGGFVKALEGGSGKQAVNAQGRLKVIFEGSAQEPQLRAILEAGRRLSDATGYNFSGTAGASEALNLAGSVGQGLKAAAGAAAPLLGLRQITNASRVPFDLRRTPLIQAPQALPGIGRALLPGAAIPTARSLTERDKPKRGR